MSTQIKLPNLGENIESGDVLSILVREGDTVKADQDLLELETDKATMPIPSPQAGKITKVLVREGDTVNVGAPIMEIEATEGSAKPAAKKPEAPKPEKARAAAKPKEPEKEEAEEQAKEADVEGGDISPDEEKPSQPEEEEAEKPQPKRKAAAKTAVKDKKPEPEGDVVEDVPGDGHASAAAGPAVRRLARQLGVELRRVRPTGAGGRITVEDVRAHVRETNEQVAATMPRGVTPPGAPDTDEYGGVRLEKMSRLRQTIARNMVASYTTIPQLTNFDDADVTELEDMREQSKADYADRGIKLTSLPFLIKAVASSLKRHPMLNSSVDMEENQIIYKEYVNIGIAVDTERGLVVPVIRDADRKSIAQIASELDELATTVRDGKFDLEILRGGTFTISNLGSVGGTYSTPLINPPQVAILLSGRSRVMPQIVDGEAVEPRLMMPLSITYDHRVVDGAAAARFLNEVKGYLAAPGRLLLAP
ncbi:MAG TPA: dihydrolipoamide acetyltransferase family protein [Lacipirellulaceae bacterium]|jgi:pyruvate dehydrogenase E2 component (dihydrolipoamide acetyltransferase)|nr:dihydrolipoamide acetyltransferase family protein [Lacipirellulaceae bacterium]